MFKGAMTTFSQGNNDLSNYSSSIESRGAVTLLHNNFKFSGKTVSLFSHPGAKVEADRNQYFIILYFGKHA